MIKMVINTTSPKEYGQKLLNRKRGRKRKSLKLENILITAAKNTLLLTMPQEIVGIVHLRVPVDGVLMVR